jgi:phosphate transport system substrate-binding protein
LGGNLSSPRQFAEVSGVPSGRFKYVGDPNWVGIQSLNHTALQAARPEFTLEKLPETGLAAVIEGKAAFAQRSQPLSDAELKQAQEKGVQLKQRVIALDAIAVVVHPSSTLSGLTTQQLQAIESGKLTNWQAVGGSNAAIKLYRTADSNYFNQPAIQDTMPSTTEALRQLTQDPNGIYYGSAARLFRQCDVKLLRVGWSAAELVPPYEEPLVPPSRCPRLRNQIARDTIQAGEYPLLRKLFVVTKENAGQMQQAGEAYVNLMLTEQGQSLIEHAGFVRVRS